MFTFKRGNEKDFRMVGKWDGGDIHVASKVLLMLQILVW